MSERSERAVEHSAFAKRRPSASEGVRCSYELGIDFGSSSTVAVVRRAEGTGDTEVVPLGARGGGVSSVLHLARDGRVTVGEAAASLAGIDPTRVVRGLKRRMGDAAPVELGGQPWAAEELSARLVRWVVDRVVEKEGEQPTEIALAHPASWAPPTLERLASALAAHDLSVTFVAEPHAVAHAAFAVAEPGATVAVHDFGGGRFDAAVLRRAGTRCGGFAVLGVPEAIDDLGGLDLDELVWQHVRKSLPDDVTPVARVRRACTLAKETLSSENEVVVRIRCGEFRGAVRLDRTTFERLIAPHVDRTVDALRGTIASAGVEPGQLTALLLVGGSARMPLVARTVIEQLGRVPTVCGDEDLVARGAVLALSAPTAAADGVVQTTSGPPAIPSTGADVEAETPDSGEESSADDAEAPTVVLAVPAVADAPTTPLLLPATVETAHPAPAVSPASRRPGTRGRTAAVLDAGGRRAARRSLPRTLVGVGAVIVAALVLVALFRPDGPLDPPLDPGAGNATQLIAPAEVATAPTAGVPASAPAGIRTEVDADAVSTVRPAAVDTRQSVTTTPPTLPSPSDLSGKAASRAGSIRDAGVVRQRGPAHCHDAAGAPKPCHTGPLRSGRGLPPEGRTRGVGPVPCRARRVGKIHPNGGQPSVTFSLAPAMGGRGAGRQDAGSARFRNEEGAAVARLGAAVVGLGLAALVVAYLFFGWPVLLVGVPALVGVALVVAAVVVSETPRRKLEEHRATRFDPSVQLPGGLMSGFFEMPKQRPTELPDRIV